MKLKIFINLCLVGIICFFLLVSPCLAQVLTGGISKVDEVPSGFYGTWIVVAKEISNPDPSLYKSSSIDVWTLSKHDNIIILSNPVSGASASINVDEVRGNTVKFSRTSKNLDEIGNEEPTLTISGDFFDGIDKMVIKKFKNAKFCREDTITYKLRGKRVASSDIFR